MNIFFSFYKYKGHLKVRLFFFLCTVLLFIHCQQSSSTPIKDIELLIGKVQYSKNLSFKRVPIKYTSRAGMYMHKDALLAFIEMHKDAKKKGIHLKIISAGRNFYDQKRIWERKWNGKQKVEGKRLHKEILDPATRALFILRFSSMPGTSRHHWGTDIDLNALNNRYFRRGKGKKTYQWLIENAARYGYCQPYTSKDSGRTGYQEEMWHWSYKPLSKNILSLYLTNLSNARISGFDGSETATSINVIKNYVNGISKNCK